MRYHVTYYGPDGSSTPPERIARVKTKAAAATASNGRLDHAHPQHPRATLVDHAGYTLTLRRVPIAEILA